MERSFKKEVQALKLGDGETFHGEGILAVTKALLQSGVSYVGGYQGAPVSHLLDVLVDAEDIMAELGVHLETCSNEASAAAMLGASINYPLRGAVTWKSIVGTNVAADALSNLASPGVIGGAMIILGEDYGEGASVIQERSYAYALKSSMWLLDPRPESAIDRAHGRKRLRAVGSKPRAGDAGAAHPRLSRHRRIRRQEQSQGRRVRARQARRPAAVRIRAAGASAGDLHAGATEGRGAPAGGARLHPRAQAQRDDRRAMSPTSASSCMGGLTNSVLRALERVGLADVFGTSRVPVLVLNVVYPLVPEEIRAFCAGKRAVLVVEEGNPDYIEQAVNVELRRADIQTRVLGKGPLPMAGEYASDVLLEGLAAFLQSAKPSGIDADTIAEKARGLIAHKAKAAAALGPLPPRPPAFCTGCPERPVFSAIKLMQRELGPTAYQRRHRLPFVCDLRAVLARQFDPRLRHVARKRRGGDAEHGKAPDRDHGRRRLLA